MNRITFIQSLVLPEQEEVIDLCCDHGQIGLGLVRDGERNVILVDIVPEITNRILVSDIPTGVLVKTADATKIKFAKTEKKRTFIIAGVGGLLGLKILNNIIPQLKMGDEIILSLHGSEEEVYEALLTGPFVCTAEKLLHDKGRYYEIFRLKYASKGNLNFRQQLWDKNSVQYIGARLKYYSIKSRYRPQAKAWFEYYTGLLDALNNT